MIGGLEKLSLIDYPGELAAVVFTQGCNFQCPFCHNPMLVDASSEAGKFKDNFRFSDVQEGHSLIKEDDLLVFLERRKGKLDGVVVTGGEPSLQGDLEDFLGKLKEMGYKVKLDTNGSRPEVLEKLIENKKIDYLAMDFKTSPDKYPKLSGSIGFSKMEKSVKIVMNSGLPYEFRTTLVPDIIVKDDLGKIGEQIKGAEKWFLQAFINHTSLLDNEWSKKQPFTDKEMEEMLEVAKKYVKSAGLR